MEDRLVLTAGVRCTYEGAAVTVQQILDLAHIVIETASGHRVTVAPQQLQVLSVAQKPERDTYQFAEETARQIALSRYAIIRPLLQRRIPAAELADTLTQHHLSEATLRRWMRAYTRSGLCGLLKHKPQGGRRGSRLNERREQLLQDAVQQYLSLQRPSAEYVHQELRLVCARQQLCPPSLNTLRRRIAQLPSEERIRRRRGGQVAQ